MKGYHWNKWKKVFWKVRVWLEKFTKFVSWSIFGEPQLMHKLLKFQTSCGRNRRSGSKTVAWLFCYFYFKRNYDVLKSKSPYLLLNKQIKSLIKTRWNWKWKILHVVLKRLTMYFSLYKNCKLKLKLMSWGLRKKSAFFVTIILSEGNVFNICVLSKCIVYWIKFQNRYTFTYQKTTWYTYFLFLESSKAVGVSLRSFL